MARATPHSPETPHKNAKRVFKASLAMYGARLNYVGNKASRRAQIAAAKSDIKAVKKAGTKTVEGISKMPKGAKVATGVILVSGSAYGARKAYVRRRPKKNIQGGHNHGKRKMGKG